MKLGSMKLGSSPPRDDDLTESVRRHKGDTQHR